MSFSEFKWNKRRKHYAYCHKKRGSREENILLTSKPFVMKHKRNKERIVLRNISLYHHPNPNKEGQFYVIPRNYVDESKDFDFRTYDWKWDKNDKRKIKRIKKLKNRR
jgi:hypothetical protein